MRWDVQTGRMDKDRWAALFEDQGDSHVAMFYRDVPFLADTVARWIAPALRGGGGGVLVGSAAHTHEIRRALRAQGINADAVERAGRLVFVDADWLLATFIVDPSADRDRFRATCTEIVQGVRARVASAHAPVRAWGEMVSLLRLRGSPETAVLMEEEWNKVLEASDFALLCSYEVTSAVPASPDVMQQVAHTHGEVLVQPGIELTAPAL